MRQNFGSKPQMSCKIVIDTVMIIGFLYFKMSAFINQQQPPPGVQPAV